MLHIDYYELCIMFSRHIMGYHNCPSETTLLVWPCQQEDGALAAIPSSTHASEHFACLIPLGQQPAYHLYLQVVRDLNVQDIKAQYLQW